MRLSVTRVLARGLRERDLIVVNVTERKDTWKDRCIPLQNVKKGIARQPAGPARREVKRGGRKRQRVAAGREARNKLAVAQREDKGGKEWRGRCNRKDAGESPCAIITEWDRG